MRSLSLCSGIGGLDLAASAVFDAEAVCVAEVDRHASKVLAERFDTAANIGDFTSFNLGKYRGGIDMLTAGFPCQDISSAGKGAGLGGERSGLWFDVLDVLEAVRPEWVVIENVPALKTRGLDVVLAGLTAAGYGGAWCYWRSGYYSKNPQRFPHENAPHQRKRLFILGRRGVDGFRERQAVKVDGISQVVCDQLLPTPNAWDGARGPDLARVNRPNSGGMTTVERLLPTPLASQGARLNPDGTARVAAQRHDRQRPPTTLHDVVDQLLPTPTARDGKGPNPNRREGVVDLPSAVNTWGEYAPAIERWARHWGPPPPPAIDGKLNPALCEWMLGYPAGWVTDLDIPRTQQLKMLGNSVQPQTAKAALRHLRGVLT